MNTRCVAAALVVVLVALAGCKKKPATNPGGAPQDPPPQTGPAPMGAPARLLTDAFGKLGDAIAQDKIPAYDFGFDKLAEYLPEPPAPGRVRADLTARRTEIDESFGKFWAVWDTFPERMRQKVIRDRIALLVKQGTTPDAARAQAEKQAPPLPPLKITTPNLDLRDKFFDRIDADVKGASDTWRHNGGLTVTGAVEYSEALQVNCNGDLTLKLRGRAATLALHANGRLLADAIELNAPVVAVAPNGPLLLRVGPGTRTVRLDGNVVGGLILARGNPGLKVEGADERFARTLAVVAY
jgi:hypothetical protein